MNDKMSLVVNEIFYSIQGEGARAGCASIFIRLSGCDLDCDYCDTEFTSGKRMTLEEINQYIQKFLPCTDIVWTGGESALQLNDDIVYWFDQKGYYQCIETNGNHPVPNNINFVTVSPKVAEHVMKKNFPNGVTELKYVRHAGQFSLPKPQVRANYYYLSPIFNGDKIDMENVNHCLKLIKENPLWRLSIQIHKLIKVL